MQSARLHNIVTLDQSADTPLGSQISTDDSQAKRNSQHVRKLGAMARANHCEQFEVDQNLDDKAAGRAVLDLFNTGYLKTRKAYGRMCLFA
jgi:hypothetical protein